MTQRETVLQHLKDFGSITPMEAIQEYGCTRLSDVVLHLRRAGYNIETELQDYKNRYGHRSPYAKYILKE